MRAVEALRLAEENGVRLGVAGADLILDADREPAPRVLEAIQRHKAGIVALLTTPEGDWTAEDWRVFYDERAGIAEFDGGQTRADAEALAFERCIVEWLNRNPPSENGPERCIECGDPMDNLAALPFLTGDGGHVWMHSGCHSAWMSRRQAEAADVLGRMGIVPPSG